MKRIKIIGDNYFGKWDKTRTACRAIIIRGDDILLTYEINTGLWMIPGGGLEEKENERECCIREVGEETGFLIRPSSCQLEIDEYYEDYKYISKYYFGEIVGITEVKLTEREKMVGMEARWLSIEEIENKFNTYPTYKDTDEMRRGIYLREYTALCELFKSR